MTKIKIMLIDDLASNFTKKLDEDENISFPVLEYDANDSFYQELNENFDFVWMRTPQECKFCYDFLKQIDAQTPRDLVEEVPDLMLTDYALTSHGRNIRGFKEPLEYYIESKKLDKKKTEEYLRHSPLPILREKALAAGFSRKEIFETCFTVREMEKYKEGGKKSFKNVDRTFTNEDEHNYVRPSNRDPGGVDTGNDHMGIQAGLLIYGIFSSRHPVSLIAFTAHDKAVPKTETAFLEYMYDRDLGDTFKQKGEKDGSWFIPVTEGIKVYRSRLKEHAIKGIVTVDYKTISTLAELNNNGNLPETIRFETVYGLREVPLRGLFIDVGYANNGELETPPDERNKERVKAAKEWAQEILNGWLQQKADGILQEKQAKDKGGALKEALSDLKNGIQVAETLFDAACNPNSNYKDDRNKRYAISKAISPIVGAIIAEQKSKEDTVTLGNVNSFGPDDFDGINVQSQNCMAHIGSIRFHCAQMPDALTLLTLTSTSKYKRHYQVRRWAMLIAYVLMVNEIWKRISVKQIVPEVDGKKVPWSFDPVRRLVVQHCKEKFSGSHTLGECLFYDILYPLISKPALLPFHKNGLSDLTKAYNIFGAFGKGFKDADDKSYNGYNLFCDLLRGDNSRLQTGELATMKAYFMGLNNN